MADGAVFGGCGAGLAGIAENWPALLSRWIGTTVTIFTSSGGESGAGFTGVLLSVNEVFVRLLSRIGPPPGCALGNACTGFTAGDWGGAGFGGIGTGPASVPGAATSGGWDGFPVFTVGSVVDIPVASIVAFVHNAV